MATLPCKVSFFDLSRHAGLIPEWGGNDSTGAGWTLTLEKTGDFVVAGQTKAQVSLRTVDFENLVSPKATRHSLVVNKLRVGSVLLSLSAATPPTSTSPHNTPPPFSSTKPVDLVSAWVTQAATLCPFSRIPSDNWSLQLRGETACSWLQETTFIRGSYSLMERQECLWPLRSTAVGVERVMEVKGSRSVLPPVSRDFLSNHLPAPLLRTFAAPESVSGPNSGLAVNNGLIISGDVKLSWLRMFDLILYHYMHCVVLLAQAILCFTAANRNAIDEWMTHLAPADNCLASSRLVWPHTISWLSVVAHWKRTSIKRTFFPEQTELPSGLYCVRKGCNSMLITVLFQYSPRHCWNLIFIPFKYLCQGWNQSEWLCLHPDHCMAPMKIGPCRGSFPRWHYNAASEKCEKFDFGGCRENLNNYLSKGECDNACSGSGTTHT